MASPAHDEPILFHEEGVLGRIILNRPDALNALNEAMASAMLAKLGAWRENPRIKVVSIEAVPGRAFCAGGDIRAAAAARKEALSFFATEYKLNAAIKHFPKPYVALIDGMVMGGGAGLSVHGTYRVVSENTFFSMPETGIGLFADIGASYFLSRMPGETGMYLALTGNRMGPAGMIYSGVATHFIAPMRQREIPQRLAAGEAPEKILGELTANSGRAVLEEWRPAIDRAFSQDSVEEVFAALGKEGGWGADVLKHLATRSPTSLKLVFREIREGKALDFDACMRMEYRLVSRVLDKHDFYEGVRAALIDKDQNPRWSPAKLSDVSDADIAAYFAPLGSGELPL